MPDLELTPPLFAILSSLIEERCGLSYTAQDKELLASKLSVRAMETGFESLLDYYYYLRYDPQNEQELENLVNALVVNETFFFRELAPLLVLVSEFVEPLVRRGQRPRIWCAACSTGEEPLTLAMLLAERQLLDKVDLIATDISTSALARAQSGQHVRRSLRQATDAALAAKWLQVHERGVTVDPELVRAVTWKQLNLLDQANIQAIGRVNFILCRNVLIYFKDTVAARVVESLSDVLRPGGVLLVGISESLMRLSSSLYCEDKGNVFLYRKPPE
jgi:chemotaxis protein methyltransferase CheR